MKKSTHAQKQTVLQSFINEQELHTVTSAEEFQSIVNQATTAGSPEYHRLKNLDLSAIEVSDVWRDFGSWHIENVIFSRFDPHEQSRKVLFGLSFAGATLRRVCFAQAALCRCNFDTVDKEAHRVNTERQHHPAAEEPTLPEGQTSLTEVTFFLSHLELCRFRNTKIHAADFRYAYLNDCTIREAEVEYGDFYFCNFRGCTTFDKTRFVACSFTNCLFENNAIRMSNLPQGVIQEHYEAYHHMVISYPSWYHYNPSATYSSINHAANQDAKPAPRQSDKARMSNMAEAANFYKNMSGIYAGKGLNRDSNSAYKMAKINEIRHLHLAIPIWWREGNKRKALRLIPRLLLDYLTAAMGFGYMWWAVVFWFTVLILVYGLYYHLHSTTGIDVAISYSFNNSLGPNNAITEIINGFLASCQSAFGMLLIGFLGFIMANNLRNDS